MVSISERIRKGKRKRDPSYGVSSSKERSRLRAEESRSGGSRGAADTTTIRDIEYDSSGRVIGTPERVVTKSEAQALREDRTKQQKNLRVRQEVARDIDSAYARQRTREAAQAFGEARSRGEASSVGEASFLTGDSGFVTDTGQRVGGASVSDEGLYSPANRTKYVGYTTTSPTPPVTNGENSSSQLKKAGLRDYVQEGGRRAFKPLFPNEQPIVSKGYVVRDTRKGTATQGSPVIAKNIELAGQDDGAGERFARGLASNLARDPGDFGMRLIGYGAAGRLVGGVFGGVTNVVSIKLATKYGMQAGIKAARAANIGLGATGIVGTGAYLLSTPATQVGEEFVSTASFAGGFSSSLYKNPTGIKIGRSKGLAKPVGEGIQYYRSQGQITGMGTVSKQYPAKVFGKQQTVTGYQSITVRGTKGFAQDTYGGDIRSFSRIQVGNKKPYVVEKYDSYFGNFNLKQGVGAYSGGDNTYAYRVIGNKVLGVDEAGTSFGVQLSEFMVSTKKGKLRGGLSAQSYEGFDYAKPKLKSYQSELFGYTELTTYRTSYNKVASVTYSERIVVGPKRTSMGGSQRLYADPTGGFLSMTAELTAKPSKQQVFSEFISGSKRSSKGGLPDLQGLPSIGSSNIGTGLKGFVLPGIQSAEKSTSGFLTSSIGLSQSVVMLGASSQINGGALLFGMGTSGKPPQTETKINTAFDTMQLSRQTPATILATDYFQTGKQANEFVPGQPTLTPFDPGVPPPTTGWPGGFPPLFGVGGGKKSKNKPSSRGFKYAPSIAALFVGAYSAKGKKSLTGFEVRSIVKKKKRRKK